MRSSRAIASMVQLFSSSKLSPLKILMVSFWERAKWSRLSSATFGVMPLFPGWWTWPSTVGGSFGRARSPPEMQGEHRRSRKFPQWTFRGFPFWRIFLPWLGLWHVAMGCCAKSRAWVEVVVSSLSEAEAKPAGASNAARIGSGEFLLFFLRYASVRGIAVHRGASRLGFQFTGSGEHGIPDLFCGKPLRREAPEKTVFGIVYFSFPRARGGWSDHRCH